MITATHRNLEEEIRKGSFREDLYYRLNVISVHLPPLRERREDIPPLIDHFLKKVFGSESEAGLRYLQGGKGSSAPIRLSGNVRELENLIERAVVLCRGEGIMTQDLPFHLQEGKSEALWGVQK